MHLPRITIRRLLMLVSAVAVAIAIPTYLHRCAVNDHFVVQQVSGENGKILRIISDWEGRLPIPPLQNEGGAHVIMGHGPASPEMMESFRVAGSASLTNETPVILKFIPPSMQKYFFARITSVRIAPRGGFDRNVLDNLHSLSMLKSISFDGSDVDEASVERLKVRFSGLAIKDMRNFWGTLGRNDVPRDR